MTSHSQGSDPFNVLIAGAGVAGLEAALALRDHAGVAIRLTLLAPDPDFVYRPMAVQEPFAYGAAARYPLSSIAADLGAELLADAFAWVEPAARVAHTAGGGRLSYDALLLALGARPQRRYARAITVDDRHLDEI